MIVSRIFSRSLYGPQISRPGAPAMPWRNVRTFVPPILIEDMWKNLRSGTFFLFSFSMIGHAFGPWIWKRYEMRLTALPFALPGERSSFLILTRYLPVSAWN